MHNIKQLKTGQTIPLFSDYQIHLIQAQDLDAIKLMLDDPKVTEYLFFSPAPADVYEGCLIR
jgi:ribosomal-protein-alanine N-acetyltransferase